MIVSLQDVEYTDFIYSPVLAAIGISILEDNVAVSK